MSDEWLKQLKVGDKVIVTEYNRFSTPQRSFRSEVVEKITPTRQLKISNCSANFKNGTMLGSTSEYATSGVYLEPHVPERVAEINAINYRRKILRRIAGVSWVYVDSDKIEQVLAILGDSEVPP